MADRYIFSYIDKNREGIFRDLTSPELTKGRIDFLYSHKVPQNELGKKLKKIALSYRVNKIVPADYFGYWANLDHYDYRPGDVYHMILPSSSIAYLSLHYLEGFLKRHTNVRLYALLTDSMHAESPHMELVRKKLFSPVWTKVLTYDRYDAKEFGFEWIGYTYYSSFDFAEADGQASDLYYIGFDKGGRTDMVLSLYDEGRRNDVSCRFDVLSSRAERIGDLPCMKKRISYPQVVSRVKSTNCILEVLQQNQQEQSLRYLEAVVYNKKLLSNNPHLSELPCYDERYMRYFGSADEIDWDWVREKADIDFRYDGRFSPVHLFEKIQNDAG